MDIQGFMVLFPAWTTVLSLLQSIRTDAGAHKAGTRGLLPVENLTRHLMSRLKISIAISPYTHMPLWRAQEKLYNSLYCVVFSSFVRWQPRYNVVAITC